MEQEKHSFCCRAVSSCAWKIYIPSYPAHASTNGGLHPKASREVRAVDTTKFFSFKKLVVVQHFS